MLYVVNVVPLPEGKYILSWKFRGFLNFLCFHGCRVPNRASRVLWPSEWSGSKGGCLLPAFACWLVGLLPASAQAAKVVQAALEGLSKKAAEATAGSGELGGGFPENGNWRWKPGAG